MKERFCLKDKVVKSDKGFSLMELMMVLSIIAIVAQIGFTSWLDYKRRAYDTTAVSDTRNLIEAIVNDMVGAEDVNYDHDPDDGPRIGGYTKEGDARKPSLFLSPGVKAIVTGATDIIDSNTGIPATIVTAVLWHAGGTPWVDVGNPDNVREFTAVVDEAKEMITFTGLKAAEK